MQEGISQIRRRILIVVAPADSHGVWPPRAGAPEQPLTRAVRSMGRKGFSAYRERVNK